MLMRAGIAVETADGAGRLQFEYFFGLRQKIEVTVDSPKADARHAGTNHRIQLVSRGVSLDLSQFLKNNHTLPSHTSLWL